MNMIEELKQYCLDHQINQPELAKKLGVAYNTVNRWFTGRYNPSALHEHQIKKLLGKSTLGRGEISSKSKSYRVEEDPAAYNLRSETPAVYGNTYRFIEQIKIVRDSETDKEDIIISYIVKEKGQRVRKTKNITGEDLVQMIEKREKESK